MVIYASGQPGTQGGNICHLVTLETPRSVAAVESKSRNHSTQIGPHRNIVEKDTLRNIHSWEILKHRLRNLFVCCMCSFSPPHWLGQQLSQHWPLLDLVQRSIYQCPINRASPNQILELVFQRAGILSRQKSVHHALCTVQSWRRQR